MSFRVLAAMFAAFILNCAPARADFTDPDFFHQTDKQEHMAASFALMLGFSFFMSQDKAAAITLGIGLSKEFFYDKEVDPGDIGANMIGVIVAIPFKF